MNLADKLSDQLLEVESGCWEFIGGRTGAGYGNIGNRGTHVIAYEIENGPIPKGKFVLHKCDNRACCRPEHLFLGTPLENTQDMIAKGRKPMGEDVPIAKLTKVQVIQIKRLLYEGYSVSSIAEEYDVSRMNIYHIKSGRNWGWV